MRGSRRAFRLVAAFSAAALLAVACGDDGTAGDDGGDTTDTTGDTTDGDATDGGTDSGMSLEDIDMGVGVTAEPCPDAVDDTRGCIYLGTISDFSGPFAGFGEPLTAGQQAFWDRANSEGGIGGMFEVNVGEFVEDAEYNPEQHVQIYQQLEPEVLALAQSLGTSQSLAIAENVEQDSVISGVQTWWSGWEFNDHFLQSGTNYCIDAMNALDWALTVNPDISSVASVYFPNDYGKDALAGLKVAAEANDVEVSEIPQVPIVLGGNTEEATSTIVRESPDLVLLTTGPEEMAKIVGGAAQGEYQGMFIGNHPTFFPQLMDTAAGPAIQAMYHAVAPGTGYSDGESAGHDALREAAPDAANDGVTYGWVAQYPIKAALEAALEGGALTRDAVVAAAADLEVDYEGMLPMKSYGGEPDDTIQRQSSILEPDPELTLKLGTTVEAFVGPTAESFEFTEPCAQP